MLPGDALEIDILQGHFDRAMICNVLRLETPQRAEALERKAAEAVASGADLVSADSWRGEFGMATLIHALYALSLASRTGSPEPHSLGDIEGCVQSSGFEVTMTAQLDEGVSGALFASRLG
ncbi:MAG: hypothetical protein HQ478_01600 [Chloroflexi bacterium]|nr:hypothetical protein [Chloroflexota bacterium]